MANENYQDFSEGYLSQLFSNKSQLELQDKIEQILVSNPSWPIFYHLSPIRENILNWYNFGKNKSILEIGAGCGAITGVLCNKLKKVVANELSEARATIIKNRYKNTNNLTVLSGNFNSTKLTETFDYVSLIGVLEYAAKYTHTKNPFEDFLLKAKSYLKKNGTIIIAIENKFGLKYWSGCREDHTGRHFDSIENYPNSKEIQTFGKQEIIILLNNVGFKDIKFYYPYPDYKLATEIFSDDYLPSLQHNVKSSNFPYIDRSQNREYIFNERLVMDNIIINKQIDFFSNSFLIFAKV